MLVIGGGVTGCGVALDAAVRGLRTALVEAEDFASGTSSKSSKLVHGGLRYLQQHDYRLVYEALHERQRLLANAPHLVHPLPFLVPLFGRDGVVATGVAKAYSVALWLYDLTGGIRIGKRHQRIDAAEALSHFPVLRTDRLAAAFVYWDAQADDARLTLALARTAAAHGATVANYAPVVELLDDGRRLTGVRLAGGTEVRAPGGGQRRRGVVRTDRPPERPRSATSPVSIRPAKGIHWWCRPTGCRATSPRCYRCRATGGPSSWFPGRPMSGRHRDPARAGSPTSALPTPTTTDRSTTPSARPRTSSTCCGR